MICESPECEKEIVQPPVGARKRFCDQRCRATARRRKLGVPKKVVIEDRAAYEREYHRKRRRRLGIPERKPRMTGQELEEAKARWRETRNRKRRESYEHKPRVRRERAARVHKVVQPKVELPKLPLELSQAYGRAGYGSMMKRKYPTREDLVRAYRAGELPIKPVEWTHDQVG